MALKLKGSTSGFVGLDAPAVSGNNTLILPENSGSAFQLFGNDITAGVTTFTQVTVSRNGDLTVPGTISIGGTLTYEDVTSVDSVGIVTARGLSIFGNTTGLQVASGISTFQAVTGTTGTFSSGVRIENTAYSAQAAGNELIVGTTTGDNGITIASGNSGTGNIYFGDGDSNSSGYIRYDHNSNFLKVNVNGSERVRIDSSGRVIITNDGVTHSTGTNTQYSSLTVRGNTSATSARAAFLTFARSEASANIAANEGIGEIWFGDQQAGEYGAIKCTADAAAAVGDYPGRLTFHTTADGGTTMYERLRITKDGNIEMGSSVGTGADFSLLDGMVINTNNGSAGLIINSSSSSHNAYMAFGYGSGSGTSHNDQFSAYIGRLGDNQLAFGTNNGIRGIVDASGNFGINNTTPGSFHSSGQNLVVGSGSGEEGMTIYSGNTSNGVINFADSTSGSDSYEGRIVYQHNVNAMTFHVTDGSERMRITNNGQVLVGTNSNNSIQARLAIVSDGVPSYYANPSCLSISSSNSADSNAVEIFQGRYNKPCMVLSHNYNSSMTFAFFEQADNVVGSITGNGSNASFNTSSDYRLKENIVNITDGITRLKQLTPRRFNWIADSTNTLEDGFIAHEVSQVIPEAVTGEKDAVEEDGSVDPQQMDYSKLTPLLTAALQEAITKIETLEAKVAALEGS